MDKKKKDEEVSEPVIETEELIVEIPVEPAIEDELIPQPEGPTVIIDGADTR